MSCFYPKRGFEMGINPKTGKKLIKITPFNTYYCINPDTHERVYDSFIIPCGNCRGCHLDYAKQWSIRCCLEASFYDHNYFVTITYDDQHNTRNLIKDDLRNFIKKLRTYLSRENKPEIRFFASGEYGSTTLRPHFHVIFFNLEIEDLKFYKRTPFGNLYTSEWINNIWNKGHIIIGECNYRTCGYVARYCMKKFDKEQLKDFGFNKEFILMSRRPGIGFGFYEKNKDEIYKYDSIYFNFGNMDESTPPRYFDRLFDKENSELLKSVKDIRKLKAETKSLNEFINTNFADELEYIKQKEIQLHAKTKILLRSKI